LTNPVHAVLLERLANQQVLFETLIPREQLLREQVEKLREETGVLNRTIIEKETELDKLERDRGMEMRMLNRERAFVIGRLEREVATSTTSFTILSEKFEESRLAQSDVIPDVSISSQALRPQSPSSPRPLLNTAIALVLGGFISIIGAFFLEFIQNSREGQPVTQISMNGARRKE